MKLWGSCAREVTHESHCRITPLRQRQFLLIFFPCIRPLAAYLTGGSRKQPAQHKRLKAADPGKKKTHRWCCLQWAPAPLEVSKALAGMHQVITAGVSQCLVTVALDWCASPMAAKYLEYSDDRHIFSEGSKKESSNPRASACCHIHERFPTCSTRDGKKTAAGIGWLDPCNVKQPQSDPAPGWHVPPRATPEGKCILLKVNPAARVQPNISASNTAAGGKKRNSEAERWVTTMTRNKTKSSSTTFKKK